jgi:hypothetical protein
LAFSSTRTSRSQKYFGKSEKIYPWPQEILWVGLPAGAPSILKSFKLADVNNDGLVKSRFTADFVKSSKINHTDEVCAMKRLLILLILLWVWWGVEKEERKAGLPGRERAAQLKLEETNRRMQQAQQQQQRALNKDRGDDSGDAFLGYHGSGAGYGYSNGGGRHGPTNLYRGYSRENNSLYYKDSPNPGPKPPLRPGAPAPPRGKVHPKSDREKF